MKKIKPISRRACLLIISAFLLLISNSAFSQTVSNPSFEILTTPWSYPNNQSQMDKAAGWTQPTGGTCDYWYASPPNPYDLRITTRPTTNDPHIPISAHDGSAYVGGFLEFVGPSYNQYNYKEYITNKLSTKLTAGVTYDIVFYTLHLYGRGFESHHYVDLIDSEKGYLGICFSSAPPTGANTTPTSNAFPNSGGIVDSWNASKRVLIPASNTEVYGAPSRNAWVRVQLQYTADGTEEYMTIGQWRGQASAMSPVEYSVPTSVYYLYDNFSPVIAPNAGLSKSISPATISDGGTATYTFNITNTAAGSINLSNLSFTDTLPGNLRIASTPNVTVTGLTGGTYTANAGGTSISVSGYSIAAGTTATITVNVTNVPGQLNANCSTNPAAFTNSASNISNLSVNLTNNITPVCLTVTSTACSAGTAGSNQTINSGTAPVALTLTGSTGNIQWQVSTDNVNFTNVASNGNTASYSPGTLTATRYYRAVVSSGSCTATSNVVTITVDTLSCNSFATILTSGTSVVNGVTITATSSGSISNFPPDTFALCSGESISGVTMFTGSSSAPSVPGPFSITLDFSSPVNNLVLGFHGGGNIYNPSATENFIFTSNGGAISITSPLNANCTATINANQISLSGNQSVNMSGGGGLFRISSPNNFTTLTISGNGGSYGTAMGFCSSSISASCSAGTAGSNQTINSGTAPAALTLTGSTGNIQWQVSTDNVNFTNVVSGGNTASYSPGTLTATRYYRAVVSSGSCTATSNVVTITISDPCAISASNPDSDGDGIADDCDLDDDNDGILDTDEILFCDQSTPPNGAFPANINAANTYQKQLLFFDWSGVTISNSSPTATKSVVFNGVTYTATVSGYSSTGGFPMVGSDINTFNGGGQMIKNYYNVNGNTFKEIFYNTANQKTTNTLNVKVTATQGSVTYPVEVVVFDPEATNSNNGPESLIYTTTGSNFTLLQKTGSGTINANSITGEGTSTLTYVNTETTNVNALFTTRGYSPTIGVTLNMPLSVGSRQGFGIAVRLACDIDGDGIPNRLDLDSDNDGCSDAIEGAANITAVVNSNMPGGNVGATSGTYNQPVIQNLGNAVDNTPGSASYGVPTIAGSGQAVGSSQNSLINACFCFEDPTLVPGETYPVKHGITILGRAGKMSTGIINTAGDWPMMRNSAYTALESKTKGFVITRNSSPETTIVNPVVGMMVFDTNENAGAGCLKIYVGSGAGEGWKCFNTQGCPTTN